MAESQEQNFNNLVSEDVRENLEILKYEPEGNLTTVNLRDEPELLPEVAKSYRAIFGDKPWGVLKDSNGDLVTWAEADELLKKRENVSFDEAYTSDEVTKLLSNWVNLENSHIIVEKDERGRVFSLLAWFEHDTVEGVVDQIERENYEDDEEWLQQRKPELLENLRKNSFGKFLYVADMAKLPVFRGDVNHVMSFWLNLTKEIVVDYYGDNPDENGMTSFFRTSGKVGSPLNKQIERIFKIENPVYRESDDIVYYIIQGKQKTFEKIISAVDDGELEKVLEGLSELTGGASS